MLTWLLFVLTVFILLRRIDKNDQSRFFLPLVSIPIGFLVVGSIHFIIPAVHNSEFETHETRQVVVLNNDEYIRRGTGLWGSKGPLQYNYINKWGHVVSEGISTFDSVVVSCESGLNQAILEITIKKEKLRAPWHLLSWGNTTRVLGNRKYSFRLPDNYRDDTDCEIVLGDR